MSVSSTPGIHFRVINQFDPKDSGPFIFAEIRKDSSTQESEKNVNLIDFSESNSKTIEPLPASSEPVKREKKNKYDEIMKLMLLQQEERKQEKAETVKKFEEHDKKFEESQKQRKEMEQKFLESEKKLVESESKQEINEKKFEESEKKREANEKEIKELKDKHSFSDLRHDKEIKELKDKHSFSDLRRDKEIKELNDKHSSAVNEIQSLRKDNFEKDKIIKTLRAQVDELMEQNRQNLQRKTELEGENDLKNRQIKELEFKLHQTEEKEAKAKQEKNKAVRDYITMQNNQLKIRDLIKSTNESCDLMAQEKKAVESDNRSLKIEKESIERQNEDLVTVSRNLNNKLSKKRTKISQLKERISTLERQGNVPALQAQNIQLQQERDTFKNFFTDLITKLEENNRLERRENRNYTTEEVKTAINENVLDKLEEAESSLSEYEETFSNHALMLKYFGFLKERENGEYTYEELRNATGNFIEKYNQICAELGLPNGTSPEQVKAKIKEVNDVKINLQNQIHAATQRQNALQDQKNALQIEINGLNNNQTVLREQKATLLEHLPKMTKLANDKMDAVTKLENEMGALKKTHHELQQKYDRLAKATVLKPNCTKFIEAIGTVFSGGRCAPGKEFIAKKTK